MSSYTLRVTIELPVHVTIELPVLASMQLRQLGLGPGATKDEVRTAWRTAVKRAHPDLGGSPEAVRKLYGLRDGLRSLGLM